MKNKKNNTADVIARRRVRGAAAIFSATAFLAITAAFGYQYFVGKLHYGHLDTVLLVLLSLNTVALWMTIFSRGRFGLRVMQGVKIAELAAVSVIEAFVGCVLALRLTAGDASALEPYIGRYSAELDKINIVTLIALLVCGGLMIVYRSAVIAAVSSAKKRYVCRSTRLKGRFYGVMSFVMFVLTALYAPVRIFAHDIAEKLNVDISALELRKIDFDFANYKFSEGCALAILLLVPFFYLLQGIAALKYARDCDSLEKVHEQAAHTENDGELAAAAAAAGVGTVISEAASSGAVQPLPEQTASEIPEHEIIEAEAEKIEPVEAISAESESETSTEPDDLITAGQTTEEDQPVNDGAAEDLIESEAPAADDEVTVSVSPEERETEKNIAPDEPEPVQPAVQYIPAVQSAAQTGALSQGQTVVNRSVADPPVRMPVPIPGSSLFDFGYSENEIE